MWIEPVVRPCKVDEAIIDDDIDDQPPSNNNGNTQLQLQPQGGEGAGGDGNEGGNKNGTVNDGGIGTVEEGTNKVPPSTSTTRQKRRSRLWCTVSHNKYFLLQKRRKRKVAPPMYQSSGSTSSTASTTTNTNLNRAGLVPGSTSTTSAKSSPLKAMSTSPSHSVGTVSFGPTTSTSTATGPRGRSQTERVDFKSRSGAYSIAARDEVPVERSNTGAKRTSTASSFIYLFI